MVVLSFTELLPKHDKDSASKLLLLVGGIHRSYVTLAACRVGLTPDY